MSSSRASEASLGWLYEPVFPSDWERTKLYPLATWINGMAFKDIHFSPTGRPVIKIAEVKNGITSQTRFTTAEYDARYRVEPGDLIFSWSGQPETSIGAFIWAGPEGWLNQHLFKVLPDEAVCDWQFFKVMLDYLRPNFIGIASNKQTTGLGHVTKVDLENMTVALPDWQEQERIGACLAAIDAKELLNDQRARELDILLRQLFRETQESPAERCLLSDIATFRKGVSYRSVELAPSKQALVTLKSVGRDGNYQLEGLKPWTGEPKPDQIIAPGEMAVAQTDLTQGAEVVGRVIRVPAAAEFDQLVASLDLTIVRPRAEVEPEYLFATLLDPRFREHCRSRTQGTTVLHLASDALPSYEVELADAPVRRRFASAARAVLARRDSLERERGTLLQLRRVMLHSLFSDRVQTSRSGAA
jgi:type I restriction enzyme S subunit